MLWGEKDAVEGAENPCSCSNDSYPVYITCVDSDIYIENYDKEFVAKCMMERKLNSRDIRANLWNSPRYIRYETYRIKKNL